MASNQHNILNPILFTYFPKYSEITKTILEYLAYNYWYEKDNILAQIWAKEGAIYPQRTWKNITSSHPFDIISPDTFILERNPFPFWDINLEDFNYYRGKKSYYNLSDSNLYYYYKDYFKSLNNYIKLQAITDQSEIIKEKENSDLDV